MFDSSRSPWRRPRVIALTLLLLLLTGIAIAEWRGWPFLASPLQNLLSGQLERRVQFIDDAPGTFTVRFIGGVRLHSARLDIASAPWSTAPHLLDGRDVSLRLRYIDLWHAWRGQPLRIESLQAGTLDAHLERLADGRASWQFAADSSPDEATEWPRFGEFRIHDGLLRFSDLRHDVTVEARISVTGEQADSVMNVGLTGAYRDQPVKITLRASGTRPESAAAAQTTAVALTASGSVGRATLDFAGSASGVQDFGQLSGRFKLAGPSLAAIGDPIGVTLPGTPPFRASGTLDKSGGDWQVGVEEARVGSSQLQGDFRYGTSTGRPLLSGRLGGARLVLADLGPALGGARPARRDGKVLPGGAFDLAALRAMDADIAIDVAEVDLGTPLLGALQPLRAQLRLAAGVLSISGLDARTAEGWLKGDVELDGRGDLALWSADLRWGDVRLEQWLRQARTDAPPYVAGRLGGRATVTGQGRSTAEILASLKGRVQVQLREGRMSHLVVEAAGLDLAEALGLLVSGDTTLPLDCAVADIQAEAGVLRPQVMVLDTEDSTVSVSGSLSLAAETLDLTAIALPKDFSPLTLRSPLRVQGSFADPQVSLEKAPIGMKVAGAALLALLNPLAALLPLVDTGSSDEADRLAAGCAALARRGAAKAAPTK
ncbi:AsmA family protein [Methyloversatilis sp.]|uniref:AsmA family protein n=1 Tax=Methyloversatilis sp. TaxID=2569862 RepID=UPI0027352E79|nr:AsmA family protein [Methyloversatilis sp.]MDP2868576.1 AsmA-like C-terminal region-containing protein [Methyloversatilis sp.]MDP3457270.1 AsmA-like C-terminal region-containing protein [Methyloversatilis sp.]MDP3576662.1 AsmA-like C-terminal region-containing protein [Methyloversatilis sp.]